MIYPSNHPHQNTTQSAALFYAVENSEFNELKQLLVSDSSLVFAVNLQKSTPLDFALQLGNFEAAKLLMQYHADLGVLNKDGLTPLHTIVKHAPEYINNGVRQESIIEIAKICITNGAIPSAQDRRGNTVINFISQKAKPTRELGVLYTRLGKLVMEEDSTAFNTVRIKNNMGKIPLDYLLRNRNMALRDAVYDEFLSSKYKANKIIEQGKISVEQATMLNKEMA